MTPVDGPSHDGDVMPLSDQEFNAFADDGVIPSAPDVTPDPTLYPKEWPLPKPPVRVRTPVRHHVRHEWFFTRMPNGDVVVSAGDGIQMISIAPNEWESVVREMAEAFQNETVSAPADLPRILGLDNYTLAALRKATQEREDAIRFKLIELGWTPPADTHERETSGRVSRECKHEESLYGRCVACGMTWEQQASVEAAPWPSTEALRRHPNTKLWECTICGHFYDDAGPGPEPSCPYCELVDLRKREVVLTDLARLWHEQIDLGTTQGGGRKYDEHCLHHAKAIRLLQELADLYAPAPAGSASPAAETLLSDAREWFRTEDEARAYVKGYRDAEAKR